MSRLIRSALVFAAVVAGIWALALPTSDLPNASGDTYPLYQNEASQEPGIRGYLTSRYVPLATKTPPTEESNASGPEGLAEECAVAVPTPEREKFSGLATWYGAAFHGSRMRNGKTFNMYDQTIAAANLWPMGSILKVTNDYNGEAIEVIVQDTGGFRTPLLVDLSYAAFGLLDQPSRGVIPVTVEVIMEGG